MYHLLPSSWVSSLGTTTVSSTALWMNFPPWTRSSIRISLQLRFEHYLSCCSTPLSLAAARNTTFANAFGVLIIFKHPGRSWRFWSRLAGGCPVFFLGQTGMRKESAGVNLELAVRESQVSASALMQSPHNLRQLMYLLCFGALCLLEITRRVIQRCGVPAAKHWPSSPFSVVPPALRWWHQWPGLNAVLWWRCDGSGRFLFNDFLGQHSKHKGDELLQLCWAFWELVLSI